MKTNIYEKKISVIIPVYNVEQYLERCINSVLEQSYSNLQVILIDDGSSDSSGELCDYYAEKDERIKVLHQSNRGVSAARNEGIKLCTGEFFCFLDSDDAMASEILYESVKQIEKEKADVVVFGWKKIYNSGAEENWNPESEENHEVKKALKKLLQNFSAFGGGYPNKLWRTASFKGRIPYYDVSLTYFEDSEWMTRMLLNINKISVLNKIGYLYYIRENSVTFQKGTEEKKERGYHESMMKIVEDLNEDLNLQQWFQTKYAPELINGCIHAKRKKWKGLQVFLEEETIKQKRKLLLNNKIPLKTRIRCFLIIVRNMCRRSNGSEKAIDD